MYHASSFSPRTFIFSALFQTSRHHETTDIRTLARRLFLRGKRPHACLPMKAHSLTGLGLAVLASVLGVAAAVLSSCGIGLALGTGTWCSPLTWFVGSIFAMATSLTVGLPMWLLFRRLGLERHWQYVLGGVLCALPAWYMLALPFDSARWQHAGGFDSLNYLGSGAFGGFFFWWLSRRVRGDAQQGASPMVSKSNSS